MVAVALLPPNDVIEEDGASKGRLRTEAEDGLADGRTPKSSAADNLRSPIG